MTRIKSAVEDTLPDGVFWVVRSIYGVVSPNKETSIVVPHDGLWLVVDIKGGEYLTPSPKRASWPELVDGKIFDKYTLEGFAEVEPNDIVFDIGAFVGGFSRPAAKNCKHVVCIEPDPKNKKALEYNLNEGNEEIVRSVAWKDETDIELQLGHDPTDHSVLSADDGGTGRSIEVKARTIDDLAAERGIDTIDFLKIDAEGAEPEVLSGIEETEVKKIAVDCSFEREGEATFEEIEQILQQRGFATRRSGEVLFGRLKPESTAD
ncbi:FkbM family methyltransferase [Halorientalis litorea]|uniref:FkbM family methyltransferase n=1 Tax=Halorientalis litorea TaxID=2931977 RepID=UPI001FF27588|nr:FkbM family methyltransferase [Halorientalis litorea]